MNIKTEFDALPLEYKLKKRCAGRNVNLPDIADHPVLHCKICILGLGLQEQPVDIFAFQRGLVSDYSANPFLISQDPS